MSREIAYVPVTVQRLEQVTTYKCDKCGADIHPDSMDELYANDLFVSLNLDECVSFAHQRDYCTECVTPVWAAICELIGADPDSEKRTGAE